MKILYASDTHIGRMISDRMKHIGIHYVTYPQVEFFENSSDKLDTSHHLNSLNDYIEIQGRSIYAPTDIYCDDEHDDKPKNKVYGPIRKGKGGKIKRW